MREGERKKERERVGKKERGERERERGHCGTVFLNADQFKACSQRPIEMSLKLRFRLIIFKLL